MTEVYIMSGPCSSGKTHAARGMGLSMYADGMSGVIFSADHYFYGMRSDYRGLAFEDLKDWSPPVYEYESLLVQDAHNQCGRAFIMALTQWKPDVIIVDNTNIRTSEKAPYYQAAEWCGFEVQIIRMKTKLSVCLHRVLGGHKGMSHAHVRRQYSMHHSRNHNGDYHNTPRYWRSIEV